MLSLSSKAQQVKIWEEDIVKKAYIWGENDKNPVSPVLFEAFNRVYPYSMQDNLTDITENKKYRVIFLENEFIKVCVILGLAGYLHYAINKTNNQEFVYHNKVFKPAFLRSVMEVE